MPVEYFEDVDEERPERHPEVVDLINANPRDVMAQINADLADQPPEVRRWVTRAVIMGMVTLGRRRGR